MAPLTESLNILQVFDKALRLECEAAGIFLHDNGVTLKIRPGTGAQLALTHRSDRILLSYLSSRLQQASYIVHEAEGERFSTTNHPDPMDAYDAARYLVERLLNDEMP